MRLIITRYLDVEPAVVTGRLPAAVEHGLGVAADRVAAPSAELRTEPLDDGVRLHGGLESLDGSELRVSGSERLSVLECVVPWVGTDHSGTRFRAASAFAHAVADEVAAAA